MGPQKFIGGAERARRQAQSRGWEPPSQKRRRLEREAEQKKRNRSKAHGSGQRGVCVVPLSTKKLRSSERFFASLLEARNFPRRNATTSSRNPVEGQVLETICARLGLGPPPPKGQKQNYHFGSENSEINSKSNFTLPFTDNPRAFFSSRAILVMEEARHELEEVLVKHTPQRRTTNNRRTRSGANVWIEMRPNSFDLDQKRTGFLHIGLSKASGRFSSEEIFQQRPGSCFEMEVIRQRKRTKATMLCSVAPGKPGSKLVLIVYERAAIDALVSLLQGSPDETEGSNSTLCSNDICWNIRFCVSLLSHCRQFEACDFGCVGHFKRGSLLKEIMGQKRATHIRFCDSDDSDGVGDEDIEEREEEIVGYITEETDGDCVEGEGLKHDDNNDNQSNEYNSKICEKEKPQSKLHLTMSSFTRLKALNPTQKMAAEKFCSSDKSDPTLQLIQGPPGTGKTTFVVSVLARLLCQAREKDKRKRPRRILVTAPTNKAVGVIAKRFLDSCPGLLDRYAIPVALIGVQDKLLEPDDDGKVDGGLKRIFCYTWLDTLAEEYESLLKQLSFFVIEDTLQNVTCTPDAGNRGVSPWLSKTFASGNNETFMVGDDSDSDTEDEEKSSNRPALKATQMDEHSILFKIAKGLHLRLVRNLPQWSETSGAANLSRKILGFLEKDGDLAAASAYIKMLIKILNDDSSSPEVGRNDGEDNNDYDDDDDERGKRAASAVPELLATAGVVFCTLSTAGTSLMKQTRRFDDWIVDEAAAATEPELLIPLHLNPQRLLVVGDPKQLPASVSSPLSELWGLGRSLHERLAVDLGQPQTMLDIQYRMKPEIAKFPSQQFYGGKLTNGENVKESNYGSLLSSSGGDGANSNWDIVQSTPPFCFFQINGKEQQSPSGSYYNNEEAFALVALLKAIRERFHQRGKEKNPSWCSSDKIRVITFYSAQVAVLRQTLRKEGLQGVLVATVDSSQGCEADLVVLSFVRTTRAGFLRDDRRMNVALTRARHKLVCLGNITNSAWALSTRESSLDSSAALTNLLREAYARGCVSLALAEGQQ